MEIKAKTLNKLEAELEGAAESVAKFIVTDKSEQEGSVQIYADLIRDKESNVIEDFKLIATPSILDSDDNRLLLNSQRLQTYAIQRSLSIFDENPHKENYQEEAKSIIEKMLKDTINKEALQELKSLQDEGSLLVVETNDIIREHLNKMDESRVVEIFENQYLNSHPQLELVYQAHDIYDELNTIKDDEIKEKYQLNDKELSFLKLATEIGVDRIVELTDEFLEQKTVGGEYEKVKSLKELQDELKTQSEKEVLYLAKITSAVYDKYNLPIGNNKEEAAAQDFKNSMSVVLDALTQHRISLYYLMDKIEEKGILSNDVLKVVEQGFTYDKIKELTGENKNQTYVDFGSSDQPDTSSKASLKTFTPGL